MPTLSASQLEGSKPQLVAGLVAGTTNEYAVLKVNASGVLTTAGAKLLCTVKPVDQEAVIFLNNVNTILAFDSFTGSGITYNTSTGRFTVQTAGVLAIQMHLSLTIYDTTASIGYIDTTVFLNDIQVLAYINGVGGGTAYISQQGILFMPVIVGDVFYLNSFVGASPDGAVMNTSAYLNYIKIFQL